MRLLGFGTYDERSHPRIGVILTGLAQRGEAVRRLGEPLGIGTAGRVDALKGPRAAAAFARRLLGRWARIAAGSRAYRGARAPDAIVVGYLGHFDVLLARTLYPRTRIVLDHLVFAADTAADRGLSGASAVGRAKDRLLRMLDSAALAAADVVVCDTEQHLAMVPEARREAAVVVPVGAPDAWFEAGEAERTRRGMRPEDRQAGPASSRTSRLSAIFYGLFTPLQGTPVVAEALIELERRAVGLDVTLVGDGQDAPRVRELLRSKSRAAGGDAAADRVRVTWIDWVEAEALPGLVASHDVCLGIFGTSGKARRVVPNKAYQGLAAGCALVTSDTPAQRDVLGDAAIRVPAGDPTALADALQALTEPRALARARSRAVEAAEAFRPVAVVSDLADALRSVPPRESWLRPRRGRRP